MDLWSKLVKRDMLSSLPDRGKRHNPCESQFLYILPVCCYTAFFCEDGDVGGHITICATNRLINTSERLYVSLLTILPEGFSSSNLHSNSRQVAKIAYQWITK